MSDLVDLLEEQTVTISEAMRQRALAAQEIRRCREDEALAVEYRRVLVDEADKWKARAEAAERDSARYRWIRGDAPPHSERWPRWNIQRWDGRCWHSLEKGAMDAAIDEAMKEQP